LLTNETHSRSRNADHRSACATPTMTSWGLRDEWAERHGRPSERLATVRTSPEVVHAAVLSQASWPALRRLHIPSLARSDERQSKHSPKTNCVSNKLHFPNKVANQFAIMGCEKQFFVATKIASCRHATTYAVRRARFSESPEINKKPRGQPAPGSLVFLKKCERSLRPAWAKAQ